MVNPPFFTANPAFPQRWKVLHQLHYARRQEGQILTSLGNPQHSKMEVDSWVSHVANMNTYGKIHSKWRFAVGNIFYKWGIWMDFKASHAADDTGRHIFSVFCRLFRALGYISRNWWQKMKFGSCVVKLSKAYPEMVICQIFAPVNQNFIGTSPSIPEIGVLALKHGMV